MEWLSGGKEPLGQFIDVDKKCREEAVEEFTIGRLGKWEKCEKMGERLCEGKDERKRSGEK